MFLVSYSANGEIIERYQISYDEYYEGQTPVIDSRAFRAERGVRRLTGEIYNSRGTLQQSFDLSYDGTGQCVARRIVYEDGTVPSPSDR